MDPREKLKRRPSRQRIASRFSNSKTALIVDALEKKAAAGSTVDALLLLDNLVDCYKETKGGERRSLSPRSRQQLSPRSLMKLQNECLPILMPLITAIRTLSTARHKAPPYTYAQVFSQIGTDNDSVKLLAVSSRRWEHYEFLRTMAAEYPAQIGDVLGEIRDLSEYYKAHSVDFYSTLIGCHPSLQVLKQVLPDDDCEHTRFLSLAMLTAQMGGSKIVMELSQLVNWATIADPVQMQLAVRTFLFKECATRITWDGVLVLVERDQEEEVVPRITPGGTIKEKIARIEEMKEERVTPGHTLQQLLLEAEIVSRFTFHRAHGIQIADDEIIVSVYESCKEGPTFCMPLNKVLCLSQELTTEMGVNTTVAANHTNLAALGVNVFDMRKEITLAVRALGNEFVRNYSDDLNIGDVLRKVMKAEFEIQDLQAFMAARNTWRVLSTDQTALSRFASEVLETSRRIEEVTNRALFRPTQSTWKVEYDRLRHNPSAEVESFCVALMEKCKGIERRIEQSIEEIVNGYEKKRLAAMWLKMVKESVSRFLVKNGFLNDAIPADYIDQPPKSLSHVRQNLALVRRIISSFKKEYDKYQVKSLIVEIQKKVYPKIHEFVAQAKQVLSMKLFIPVERLDDVGNLDASLCEHAPRSFPDRLKKMEGTIKDIQYLETMERLEQPDNQGLEESFHIVPISGLVVSKLVRFESECKTVLELWVPKEYHERGKEGRTKLHEAVCAEDLLEVSEIVKSGYCDINETDSLGRTALHYATELPTRLHICQNLLKALDINPAIQDQLGNTCVHNMLRWGHEGDQASRQYLKVLRKLVVLSPGVGDITNKSGDTPLHLACKNAFTDAVALLLMANADANSRTKDGNTCIHIATMNADVPTLKVLLKSDVNLSKKNAADKTALDIAIVTQKDEIVELLESKMGKRMRRIAQSQPIGIPEHNANQSSSCGSLVTGSLTLSDPSNVIGSAPQRSASVSPSMSKRKLAKTTSSDRCDTSDQILVGTHDDQRFEPMNWTKRRSPTLSVLSRSPRTPKAGGARIDVTSLPRTQGS